MKHAVKFETTNDGVIIETAAGGVNYGDLVTVMLPRGGFVIGQTGLNILKPFIQESYIVRTFDGYINTALTLEVVIGRIDVSVWVSDNAMVDPLAKKLSVCETEVRIVSGARILSRYLNGVEVGKRMTLSDFYTNVSPQEIAATTW